MKKGLLRILSALILCLSLLPTAAPTPSIWTV